MFKGAKWRQSIAFLQNPRVVSPLLGVLVMCFGTFDPLVFAAASIDGAKKTDANYSYRFLNSSRDTGRGTFGYDEIEAETQVKEVPTETAEELKERHKIRSILRLVDGDSVQVSSGIRVQMIGINVPLYDGIAGEHKYREFADRTKKWLGEFMDNPEEKINEYEGMGSKVKYNDEKHGNFLYYYLYVPNQLLDDVRKGTLKKYDKWLKGKENKLKEMNDKMRAETADITGLGVEDLPSEQEMESQENEFMMSEKKFYYDDGTLRREELRKEGKLMLVREYNQQGRIIDEVFYDTRFGSQKR